MLKSDKSNVMTFHQFKERHNRKELLPNFNHVKKDDIKNNIVKNFLNDGQRNLHRNGASLNTQNTPTRNLNM